MLTKFRTLNEKGFTLIELIIVLGIMSFLVAMAVPLAGRLEEQRRVEQTQKTMENIRTAMMGPRDTYGDDGRRVLGGYLGDFGTLPTLYASAWVPEPSVWEWVYLQDEEFFQRFETYQDVYFEFGRGQPKGLWTKKPMTDLSDLGTRWHGPYIPTPRDEFPANAEQYKWTYTPALQSEKDDNRELEMRQTNDKLADAWGRTLLFYYVNNGVYSNKPGPGAAIYIVSEGPDGRSSHPAHDKNLNDNDDNIILTITPDEWQDDTRVAQTKQKMEEIKTAIVGKFGPSDAIGRPISGGYTGDWGDWPKLYTWDGGWVEESDPAEIESLSELKQPRGLWTQDPDGDGTNDLLAPKDPANEVAPDFQGFGWRGQYIPQPWGQGEEEVLRDAWGNPFNFKINPADVPVPPASPTDQVLTITSAGADGEFGNSDDISLKINRYWHLKKNMKITGWVVNESTVDKNIYVRLHNKLLLPMPITNTISIKGKDTVGGVVYRAYFELEFTEARAGYRFLEVVDATTNLRKDFTGVFISTGGTVSPLEDSIVLKIKS